MMDLILVKLGPAHTAGGHELRGNFVELPDVPDAIGGEQKVRVGQADRR